MVKSFNSFSVHIDDRNKDILVSCEEQTQALDNLTLTAAAK